MIRHIRLFWLFLKLSVQDDAAYRAEFWSRLLMTLYWLAGVAAGLWVFFSNTETIAGWTLDQVIVLIGTYHIVSGIVRSVFAPNFQRFVEEVRSGTLDFLLTKPANGQFLASFRRVAVAHLGEAGLGAAVAALGAVRSAGGLRILDVLAYLAALGCGLVILYSFWLVMISLVFWFVRIENITQIFWSLFEAGRYPLDIYPGWLRAVIGYLVPVGVVVTFPASGFVSGLRGPGLLAFASAAAFALFVASRFWRLGVASYTSASS